MKKDTVFVLSYLEFILYGHDWMDRTMLFQFRFYSTDDVEYEFMIPDFLFFIISKSDFVLMYIQDINNNILLHLNVVMSFAF